MQRHCIYKLKNNKTLNIFDEEFSRYVYVEEFTKNPLINKELNCVFRFIQEHSLELINQIGGLYNLPCAIFEEYFDLYMEIDEINQKIKELDRT